MLLVERVQSIPLDGNLNCVPDTLYGVDRFSAVGARIKRWNRWGSFGSVLCYNENTCVDSPFIHCTGEKFYKNRLVQVVQSTLRLGNNAAITHSLEYGAFSRHYDTLYILTNFEYWLKKLVWRAVSRIWYNVGLFVNWHCVDNFGIPNRYREDQFFKVPSLLIDYEGSYSLSVPRLILLAYRSTLALLKKRCSLLFRIVFVVHCVHALVSLFSCVLIGGLVDHSGLLSAPQLSLSRAFRFLCCELYMPLSRKLDYISSCEVSRSTTKMLAWLTIRGVRWIGMTKPALSGFRMFAQVATCLIYQFGKYSSRKEGLLMSECWDGSGRCPSSSILCQRRRIRRPHMLLACCLVLCPTSRILLTIYQSLRRTLLRERTLWSSGSDLQERPRTIRVEVCAGALPSIWFRSTVKFFAVQKILKMR